MARLARIGAAAVLLVVRPMSAEATSCAGGSIGPGAWGGGGNTSVRPDAVPVDAHPWILWSWCPEPITNCTFVSDEGSVAVDVIESGDCSPAGQTLELVPQEILQPARTYTLVCDELKGWPGLSFTTRPNELPAAPPSEVVVRDAWLDRGEEGNGCCGGGGGKFVVLIEDLRAPHLLEGGRIEVAYPNGEVYPIDDRFDNNTVRLPWPDGPVELTPVAADGTRGETVQIEVDDEGECAIAHGRSRLAFWLALPALWIGLARRRRFDGAAAL